MPSVLLLSPACAQLLSPKAEGLQCWSFVMIKKVDAPNLPWAETRFEQFFSPER